MIVCPNCNHQNPEGANQCEACYTPLPTTMDCPNCGASVQSDATFCGQCGFNLQAEMGQTFAGFANDNFAEPDPSEVTVATKPDPKPPAIQEPEPKPEEVAAFKEPEPDIMTIPSLSSPVDPWGDMEDEESEDFSKTIGQVEEKEIPPSMIPKPPVMESPISEPIVADDNHQMAMEMKSAPMEAESEASAMKPETISMPEPPTPPVMNSSVSSATQLQVQTASLLHVQTNTSIDIAHSLLVVHIGKPNSQIPPDIDVSGFPNSEIVSRVHADIRIEGDAHFIEDVGSSNGTYINHVPLMVGNRHRLRPGDRISLGKGDKMSFIFQMS